MTKLFMILEHDVASLAFSVIFHQSVMTCARDLLLGVNGVRVGRLYEILACHYSHTFRKKGSNSYCFPRCHWGGTLNGM